MGEGKDWRMELSRAGDGLQELLSEACLPTILKTGCSDSRRS